MDSPNALVVGVREFATSLVFYAQFRLKFNYLRVYRPVLYPYPYVRTGSINTGSSSCRVLPCPFTSSHSCR